MAYVQGCEFAQQQRLWLQIAQDTVFEITDEEGQILDLQRSNGS